MTIYSSQKNFMKKKSSKKKRSSIPRPRSAYNFFYKHQRSIILQELSSSSSQQQEIEANSLPSNATNVSKFLLGTKKNSRKRRHRKTHGMISLKELTLKIAKRWREASQEVKKPYQELASEDALRYKKEVASEAAAKAQVRNDVTDFSCFAGTGQYTNSDKKCSFDLNEISPRSLNHIPMNNVEIDCMSDSAYFTTSDLQYMLDSTSSSGFYGTPSNYNYLDDEYTPRPIEAMLGIEPNAMRERNTILTKSDVCYFMNALM